MFDFDWANPDPNKFLISVEPMFDPDWAEQFIQAYVPDMELLTFDEALGLALTRDIIAANQLIDTLVEGGVIDAEKADTYQGYPENSEEPEDSV